MMWQQTHQLLAVPQQNDHEQVQDDRQPNRLALARPREVVLQLDEKMRNIVGIEAAVSRFPVLRFEQIALLRLLLGGSQRIARRNLGDRHRAETINLRTTG